MRWFNRLRDYGTGGGAYGVRRQSGAATALSYNPAGLLIPTALQERCRASLATTVHIHARQSGDHGQFKCVCPDEIDGLLFGEVVLYRLRLSLRGPKKESRHLMTNTAPPASNPELPIVFGTGSTLGSESRLQPHPFNPAESLATDETPMEHGLYHFTMIIGIKLGRARRSARAVRTRAQNRRARSDAPCHRGIDADCLPRMVLGTENCFFRRAFI